MSHADHTLPDGYVVRVYAFGGIDVRLDSGEFSSVTTTRDGCFALAKIALEAANYQVCGDTHEFDVDTHPTCAIQRGHDGDHCNDLDGDDRLTWPREAP